MAQITVKQVMAELRDHIDKCEKANIASAKTNKALADDVKFFKDWLTGVLGRWRKFRRWVWSAAGAVILTVLAGSIGSFWNSVQSAQAAQKVAQATPTPANQAQRDAREQQILAELAKIRQQLGP